MADTDLSSTSLGLAAYAEFADRYASVAPTKAHNALYERPATIALVGDVSGLRILDAGCGPGIFSEIFARNGATVHAFDITPRMVELARIRCAGLPVTLAEGNLAEPLNWLQDASFDKIVCALALDYVADLAPVFKEFRRVASPGATLVFSMSHPMRDWMDERTHGVLICMES
jgi:ubiquinone/menaquinone biosynthesis C-methylase UbiE